MDADVIKTYVELGMGVGIVASHRLRGERDTHLRALDARHLFGINMTQLAVRRGAYLRGYVYDFIQSFAPPLGFAVPAGLLVVAISAPLSRYYCSKERMTSSRLDNLESMGSVAPQLRDQPELPVQIGLHRLGRGIGAFVGPAVAARGPAWRAARCRRGTALAVGRRRSRRRARRPPSPSGPARRRSSARARRRRPTARCARRGPGR